ncbi:integrase [Archaeoglobus profundus]|uniref:Integrase SSV1 C-terminal domain-containing protein n=1 Tax=Archaeoglobus profundus (strain DSM 5631 / JCM 9629 / NBRC 100127 / Av18) TaxID=572546 RepID=D2RGV2_ARCPA|nr:integrase [Archaeoglobus profundus]ADB57527.1 conserved hypothetical protein [Archaeoglobus profundus DSM 5631]
MKEVRDANVNVGTMLRRIGGWDVHHILSQGPDLNRGQGICSGLREEKIKNRVISIGCSSKESNIDEIRYDEVRKDFINWLYEKCSKEHADKQIYYLDKYLPDRIRNPKELFEIIRKVEKGKRHFCVGLRNLLNFYEAFDLMNEESLMKYRKIVKIPKTNQDEYVPEDSKVIEVFRKFKDERYKILFKLLAFSGIRLREALHLLRTFDSNKLITNDKIAKYPLGLDRGSKKSYYAYLPLEFSNELRRMELDEDAVSQYFAKKGLPAKYLRKWNYNFLILNGVPESVADFIQGRASITVGSMHYLAKVKQADEWYSRIISKLLNLFK